MALVKCEICGLSYYQITYRHLREHNVTLDEYKAQYPDAELVDMDIERERRRKISETGFGKRDIVSEETRAKLSENATRLHRDPGYKERWSKSNKARFTPEYRKEVSERVKELWKDPEYREKQHSGYMKGLESPYRCHGGSELTDEELEDRSRRRIEAWKNNKSFQEKMARSSFRRQRESEIDFADLLEELFPGAWKFVGNGDLVIDGKCPDFVDNYSGRILLELFENWHPVYDEPLRKSHFNSQGYCTWIVWAEEMKTPGGFRKIVEELELLTIMAQEISYAG